MIQLDVQDYCQECPEFKPGLEKNTMFADNAVVLTRSIVRCVYQNQCARIKRYVECGSKGFLDIGRCENCANRYEYDDWDRSRGESCTAHDCSKLRHDFGPDGYCSLFEEKIDANK